MGRMRMRVPSCNRVSTRPSLRGGAGALCARAHTPAGPGPRGGVPGAKEGCRVPRRGAGCRGGVPGLSALADRDVLAPALAGVDLARSGDLLLLVLDHLQPPGDPAA